jgi:MoaA/NifB/PqqE/SkfB family radical SAM enzyme
MLGNNKFDVTNALKRLPALPRDFFVTTILSKFKAIYPTSMIYNVSWRCNAKCVMCNNWLRPYDKDLSLEEIQEGFKSRLFAKIANLGISGGEPYLRQDLPEIVDAAIANMPRLKKMTINTNGFATKRILSLTEPIAKSCNDNDILLGIRISLDGIGDIHGKIRGVPKGFEKCMETFEGMRALQDKYFFNFGLAYTINPINVRYAADMYDWCKERGINVIFNIPRTSAAFLDNEHLGSNVVLKPEDQQWVTDFFRRLVHEGSIFNGDVFLYHHYIKQFDNGGNRTMPCPYQEQGIILNPFGELLYCEMSKNIGNLRDGDPADAYFAKHNLSYRREIRENVCDTCLSPCMASVNAAHQVGPYIKFGAEMMWKRMTNGGQDNSGQGNGHSDSGSTESKNQGQSLSC